MHKIIFILMLTFAIHQGWSQGVGIGTATPNAKAALEIKSTDKGVLFPSLTTAQRDLITNPPDGLHIFNKDEQCLNYYDSIRGIWNCYCKTCETVIIDISASASDVDFYNVYAKYINANKYVIRIAEGVTLKGLTNAALYFSGFSFPVSIKIENHGSILGRAGNGGKGSCHYADYDYCIYIGVYYCGPDATDGTQGGTAIGTTINAVLTIDNYGMIGGGGGGGGGGGSLNNGGGGGGGGQGAVYVYYEGPAGLGGDGGLRIDDNCQIIGTAQPGGNGTLTSFGLGGAPSASNAYGGNGGGLGQPGLPGLGTLNPGAGGQPGYAAYSGTGTIIIHNLGSGQSFGIIY